MDWAAIAGSALAGFLVGLVGWFYAVRPIKWRKIAVAIPVVLVGCVFLALARDALFGLGTSRLRDTVPRLIASSVGFALGAVLAELVRWFGLWRRA